MKQIIILTAILIAQTRIMNAQDTISHISGGCIYNEFVTSYGDSSCPQGIFFNYSEDTLTIYGTIEANCCGTHFAIVRKQNDTIFVATADTGELCRCVCAYCFKITVAASATDTIVDLNGTFYNITSGISSIGDKVLPDRAIHVMPNPFNDHLTINTGTVKIRSVRISDLTGRIIKNITYSGLKEIVINTGSMYSGTYFISVRTTDNKVITKKIVKK